MAGLVERLPPEILHLIAESLCNHSLSRLSRTCRIFRDIAQPILYHRLLPPSQGRCFSLLRTLFQRPDLARAVRDMHLDNTLETLGREELIAWQPLDGELFELFCIMQSIPSVNHKEYIDGPQTWVRAYCMGVLPLICNVERLTIVVDGMGYPQGLPLSLPRLAELNYVDRRCWIDPTAASSLGSIEGILQAAPRLQIFRGFGLENLAPLPARLDNLTELYLDTCNLDPKSLDELLSRAPNLHSFFLSCLRPAFRTRPYFHPTDVVRPLERVRHTLKWLYLDYSPYDQWPPSFGKDMLKALKGLEALETLIVGDMFLLAPTPRYPVSTYRHWPTLATAPLPCLGQRDTQSKIRPSRNIYRNPLFDATMESDRPLYDENNNQLFPRVRKLVMLSYGPCIPSDLEWLSANTAHLFPSLQHIDFDLYFAQLPMDTSIHPSESRSEAARLRDLWDETAGNGLKGISFDVIPSVLRAVNGISEDTDDTRDDGDQDIYWW
ncbi:hypothetical protein BBK36DRAFT_1169803 [Trichoderma citrinoviride]|uniref:F-box domain-containing protein n=1 Tax=Trichoderma citrinoviride TaxID=58853 RepID=A0A2T4B712_9HYPO|nr:hypothetical protein BBK36DRAFT_1169803 [Trichoderma citrinoviride]PTB65019.1 hypothetical protein BBK36DRAFT_1169803 [Trichoderma citrinoviride]